MVGFTFIFVVLNFSNQMYKIGKTNSVSNVAVNNPPITTVAKGFCTSPPAPWDNAIGKKPSEATKAVIITGRNRSVVPMITICFKSVIPSFFKALNSAINTIPFKTATPKSAIKPTAAEILNGMPRNQSAKIPPIADNGIAVKIKLACFIEPKAKNNNININNNDTGTAMPNRSLAAIKFSKVPP